jgi:sphingolipid delta-4 desaturase
LGRQGVGLFADQLAHRDGPHPVAGQYISEHYVFRTGQEAYSYYGPLNRLTFNVGYHHEHYDYPYIPGSRLARLRQIAAEYYDSLPAHSWWTRVIWDCIMRAELGAVSRVKRTLRERVDSRPHADSA